MSVQSRKQNGFTLIEMIIAIAITGILGLGIATFTVQTFTETKRSSVYTDKIMQMENAGYWVSRDVQMSQNVTPGLNAGFPLQLNWTDENDDAYQVTYSLTGGQISRSLVINDDPPLSIPIAQSIDPAPALTYFSYADGLLTFNVSATLGTWTASRTYQIKQRPGL
jgi:prepilin-type N-terminal cleavage/methylation domain-containing protein